MRKSLVFSALICAVVLVTASAGMAAHVTPSVISGNPSCEGGVKIEPVVSGTYPVPGGAITIIVSGSSFSFTTSGVAVFQVIVKGGPNAHLYDYSPGGVTSDTGLTAPINPANGRPYGLSHLCFFTDEEKPPPPPK